MTLPFILKFYCIDDFKIEIILIAKNAQSNFYSSFLKYEKSSYLFVYFVFSLGVNGVLHARWTSIESLFYTPALPFDLVVGFLFFREKCSSSIETITMFMS